MADPLLGDLGLEEDDGGANPLLDSMAGLMGGGGGAAAGSGSHHPPKRGGMPVNPVKASTGKTVNASGVGTSATSRVGAGGTMASGMEREATDSTTTSTLSGQSTVSTAHTEAATDLVDAFTTLKKKVGFSKPGTVAPIVIEGMSKEALVDLAKNLFNMVDTYAMKADEWIEDSDGMENLASASMAIDDPNRPAGGLSRNPSHQSMVFKRRALHEQRQGVNSAGSGESSMSIMRPPVRDTSHVKKSTDDDGYQVINDYTIIAELGRGAYGKVKLAVNDVTGESVAIKVMKKSLFKQGLSAVNKESIVAREIAIMKKLRHKNIVSLYEVINDPEADKMYLVMQYVENGVWYTLNKKDMTCTPLPHDRVLRTLRQLISGLKYLHKRSIIHRDIKPDNILIGNDGTPYLSDFGVSEIAQSGSIHSMEGTPVFLSPEIFRGDEHVDGVAADIWALGVTVYGALFGKPPFIGRTYDQVSKAVQFAPLYFPPDNPNTPVWRDVLSRLLEKDPRHRMTLRELKMHPIFDEIDPDKNVKAREEFKVEVTDLDIMESIRNVKGFESKKVPVKSAFALAAGAKMIIHNYCDKIRKRVSERALTRPAVSAAVSGGGVSAIRGISSPRVVQPRAPSGPNTGRRTPPAGSRPPSGPSTARLPSMENKPPTPPTSVKSGKSVRKSSGTGASSGETPALPSLRKTVPKRTK